MLYDILMSMYIQKCSEHDFGCTLQQTLTLPWICHCESLCNKKSFHKARDKLYKGRLMPQLL